MAKAKITTPEGMQRKRAAIAAWKATPARLARALAFAPPVNLNPETCNDPELLENYLEALKKRVLDGLNQNQQLEAWRHYEDLLSKEFSQRGISP